MFPYKYVDRSRFYVISELSGEMPMVQIRGSFISFTEEGEGARKRLVGVFTDGRKMMQTVWFSKISAIRGLYRPGVEYVISANRHFSGMSGRWPILRCRSSIRKIPFGISWNLLPVGNQPQERLYGQEYKCAGRESAEASGFSDSSRYAPCRSGVGLSSDADEEAIVNLHFPETPDALQKARERMKFEELFYLQMHILRFSRERGAVSGARCSRG